jgi:hypothetical protein
MDGSHGRIDKVASSWTLRGWSPPWTRAAVTLRGLKSPSMWTYDSTTYRNHAKNTVSSLRLIFLISTPLLSALACFTISAAQSLDLHV